MGFEKGLDIGAVGLATTAVGGGVLGREQARLVSEGVRGAAPEGCGATGLEKHQRGRLGCQARRESFARETMALEDATDVIGDGDFEDILCQVDGDDLRFHGWTPSVAE